MLIYTAKKCLGLICFQDFKIPSHKELTINFEFFNWKYIFIILVEPLT